MPNAGFFRNSAKRPDPPFDRTMLSNRLVGGNPPPVLYCDYVPVPTAERKKYRLFKSSQIVGDYQFTWHHNIPWNILRRTWDIAITFCTEESIRALFDFYTSQHPLADQGPGILEKMLGVRKAIGIHLDGKKGCTKVHTKTCSEWIDALDEYQKNDEQLGLDSPEYDTLQVILCWGGWNLNEGPGSRVDDPGEFFDAFGPFDANIGRVARYVAVERLNKTLNDMFNEYNTLAAAKCSLETTRNPWSRELMETMRVCNALTPEQREIVYFDPLMWAPVTLSGNAIAMFNLDPYKTPTEDGMVTENLRGVPVFKQMKKKVNWKA